jgi:hypothetical protein
LALAARASKYGISLYQALWEVPLSALNQFMVYDELQAGRRPRWLEVGEGDIGSLDNLMEAAMTCS